jgi:FAD/FMN-containing dehydrogenase
MRMSNFFSDYKSSKTALPTSSEEVKEIIKHANRTRTPLVPVSTGTNLQDTHLPSVKGATTVNLSQLDRILYFDAKNRNAVIEPGVTFDQLEKICADEGLRTLTAIDVPKEASVLGTYLEMMPLYGWPKYHPWEMLTMQGFRADGEPFATGQMAMKQDRPDKYSWGVSFAQVARLFCQAQGTLGIITAAAITLKTATPENRVLFFPCKNINEATRALKTFIATEEPHEIFAVNRTYFSELLGGVSARELPPWTVVLVTRGFEKDEVAYKKKDLSALAKQLGGEIITRLSRTAEARILSEISSPSGYALHAGDDFERVPYVTIATAQQIKDCSSLFAKNSGALLMPLQAGACFYYQPDLRYEEKNLKKARAEYTGICGKLLKAGVMFPRPSALIARQVAAFYQDNFKLLKSIKKAVDPNNIMNPGKLGL